jgi:Protein of unknown function (DUF3237)
LHDEREAIAVLISQDPIFRIRADLAEVMHFGATPYGDRRVIDILGGTVQGPKLSGRVLPGGADWQIVRADGVVHLQARYTAETETGGRILIDAEGYRHGPAEVMERLARDETVDPSLYYFRTFMRFETADPASAWLNRILAIGKGARHKGAVRIEVFEVL